jgi:hypothetical protein
VSVADPRDVRAFWEGWLAWSRREGIDYLIGRRLPATLTTLGMESIEATAETALYNGGSLWAVYWTRTVIELRGRLVASGELDDRSIDAFLGHCADPGMVDADDCFHQCPCPRTQRLVTSQRPHEVDARSSGVEANMAQRPAGTASSRGRPA